MTENKTTENKTTAVETTATASTVPIKERLKSWAVWVAVLGVVGLVLQTVGVFDKLGLDGTEWDTIITALGTILAAFGIVNNPTDKSHF